MATVMANGKAMTKSEMLAQVAENTGLTRKQVGAVIDEITTLARKALGKKGAGVFQIPGLVKIVRHHKPATKGGMRENPFKKGEMMQVKPKPARSIVKVRALKSLKEAVA